jgi:hypothetical protein
MKTTIELPTKITKKLNYFEPIEFKIQIPVSQEIILLESMQGIQSYLESIKAWNQIESEETINWKMKNCNSQEVNLSMNKNQILIHISSNFDYISKMIICYKINQ